MSRCPYCQWSAESFIPCTKHALTVVGERWVDPNAMTIDRIDLPTEENTLLDKRASELTLEEQPDLLLGQMMGRFRLKKLLGRGGMGVVYLAEHESLPKKAAIKLLKRELTTNIKLAQRFFLEAKAVAELNHENAVEIQDFGQRPDGTLYLVMELLEGQSLAERLQEEPILSPERLGEILKPLCLCLSAAHEKGIIHRDLKPDNIFLAQISTPEGGMRERVKVLDFGIAKLTGGLAPEGPLTNAGAILGTPSHMPPEQIKGEQVEPGSDLYSLGVIMYQALTGKLPFQRRTPGKTLMAHLSDAPTPLRELRPSLSVGLEALVLSCLAKNIADRPQSALALWASYEALLEQEAPLIKKRWAPLLFVAGAAAMVALSAVLLWPETKPSTPKTTSASQPASPLPPPPKEKAPESQATSAPAVARPATAPAASKVVIRPEKKIVELPKQSEPPPAVIQITQPPITEEKPKASILDGGLIGP